MDILKRISVIQNNKNTFKQLSEQAYMFRTYTTRNPNIINLHDTITCIETSFFDFSEKDANIILENKHLLWIYLNNLYSDDCTELSDYGKFHLREYMENYINNGKVIK